VPVEQDAKARQLINTIYVDLLIHATVT